MLSVTLYALLIDEINKEIMKTDLGIKIPNTDCTVGCLEWMDDVVLAETETKRSQELLNITEDTSQRYHIEFGMAKTKFIKTTGCKQTVELKLGKKNLEETDKYPYLGNITNQKMNLKDQIKSIEGKVEAAYQTLITIAEDDEFRKIKMECIWKLVETCIIPIITYACETWEPNKQEMKKE